MNKLWQLWFINPGLTFYVRKQSYVFGSKLHLTKKSLQNPQRCSSRPKRVLWWGPDRSKQSKSPKLLGPLSCHQIGSQIFVGTFSLISGCWEFWHFFAFTTFFQCANVWTFAKEIQWPKGLQGGSLGSLHHRWNHQDAGPLIKRKACDIWESLPRVYIYIYMIYIYIYMICIFRMDKILVGGFNMF